MNQGRTGTQDLRSEMNPETAAAWMSTAFEGYSCSAPEYGDQVGPTYAHAVLKPRDLNRDRGNEAHTPPGRFGKPYIPRMRSRKQPGKDSLPVEHVSSGRIKYREMESPQEGMHAAFGEFIGPAPEYICQASEEYNCSAPKEPKFQTPKYEDHVQGPSYTGAVLKQGEFNRGRGHEIVSMPVRIGKPRFPRIKTRRQQKKQNRPKKDEPTFATILKCDGSASALSVCQVLQRPEELQTFAQIAEQFVLTDECTAMMTHLDLNRSFERMPYTELFKK